MSWETCASKTELHPACFEVQGASITIERKNKDHHTYILLNVYAIIYTPDISLRKWSSVPRIYFVPGNKVEVNCNQFL